MRAILLAAAIPAACPAFDLIGHIEPAAAIAVYLHGATAPFESSTVSGADGGFRFAKIPAGTYTLVLTTAARGSVVQTVELSRGTVDAKGRIELLARMEPARLESEGGRSTGATVSATVLTIPERATAEYEAAQRCLSHADSACAQTHLAKAVKIAAQFTAAWNQLGTLAYQARR